MTNIKEIQNVNEFNEAVNCGELVAIKFSADWCGPCKVLSKLINGLSEEETKGIKFYEVNTDNEEAASLCDDHSIRNLPTVLFFKSGRLIKRTTGAPNKQAFIDILTEVSNDVA